MSASWVRINFLNIDFEFEVNRQWLPGYSSIETLHRRPSKDVPFHLSNYLHNTSRY